MQLTITKAEQLKTKPDGANLGFGTIFTDHMFNMDFDPENGWHNPRVEPYASIDMDPATMVLHYGQGVFEGLKAFRTEAGAVQLFRPKDNFKRLNTLYTSNNHCNRSVFRRPCVLYLSFFHYFFTGGCLLR